MDEIKRNNTNTRNMIFKILASNIGLFYLNQDITIYSISRKTNTYDILSSFQPDRHLQFSLAGAYGLSYNENTYKRYSIAMGIVSTHWNGIIHIIANNENKDTNMLIYNAHMDSIIKKSSIKGKCTSCNIEGNSILCPVCNNINKNILNYICDFTKCESVKINYHIDRANLKSLLYYNKNTEFLQILD